MKTKGLLILLLAVLLGVYADANAGAVNNIVKAIFADSVESYVGGPFFAPMLAFYYRLPGWVVITAAILFRTAACLLALLLKPGLVKQGGGAVLFKPLELLVNGLLGYCAVMALALVFFVSVLGVPMALAFLAVMWVLTLIGQTSLSLAVGYELFVSLGWKSNAFTYISAGALLIELLRCLPILGYAISMFLAPVMCVGVVITVIVGGYFKKNYFSLPFWEDAREERRAAARNIIVKDLDDAGSGHRDIV